MQIIILFRSTYFCYIISSEYSWYEQQILNYGGGGDKLNVFIICNN